MSLNPITIRNLGPEDAHILDRVRPGLFADAADPSRVWAFLATRVNELVVALDRGEVVGFACGTVLMRPDAPTRFLIQRVEVHPDCRRQGIGRRMMERICDLAWDRGCAGIFLALGEDDAAMRALSEKLGAADGGSAAIRVWGEGV